MKNLQIAIWLELTFIANCKACKQYGIPLLTRDIWFEQMGQFLPFVRRAS